MNYDFIQNLLLLYQSLSNVLIRKISFSLQICCNLYYLGI